MGTDASPVKRQFTRFALSGLNGRSVTSAKLRLYNVDASNKGGDFYEIGRASSRERVKISVDAVSLKKTIASLGAVAANRWYEIDVTPLVARDGAGTAGAGRGPDLHAHRRRLRRAGHAHEHLRQGG